MPKIHELADDQVITIKMRKSEAIVIGVMLTEALEQLSPHIPTDAAVAHVYTKASTALVRIKAAIDA